MKLSSTLAPIALALLAGANWAAAGTLSVTALQFPATQNTPDIIYSGTSYLLWDDNNGNFFVGQQAGATTTAKTKGMNNTGGGVSALAENSNGSNNTAFGFNTLFDNLGGSENTAVGAEALRSSSSGSNNIALGYLAGYNLINGSYNIDIGNEGLPNEGNTIRIGTQGPGTNTLDTQTRAFVAGIYGAAVAGVPVYIDAAGQLGTASPELPVSFNGAATGGFNGPVVDIQNLDTTASSSPALRVIAHGSPAYGALSVSTAGPVSPTSTYNIATFGNAGEFVSWLDNNGDWYAKGSVNAKTFNNLCDRNAKENLQPVSPREVLQKLDSLPLNRWNYKQDKTAEHIGPMAQDFYAVFGVGADDKHIATVDEEGVALAAIQGVNLKLNEKLVEKDAEIQSLANRLGKLEAVVKQLAPQQ